MRKRTRLRAKLSYANVVSTLCLFLLLGGGAAYAASHLGKNTVGTKQLKREAVTAAKVKKHTLTGKQINVAKLGTVPKAKSAQSLGGLGADQIEQGSKLHCPAGTVSAGGVCFETTSRPAADFVAALETCASANRSLPSVGELAAYLLTQEAGSTPGSWAGVHYFNEAGFWASYLSGGIGGISLGSAVIANEFEFHCATGSEN